jgi:PAS domain S-box-containing protein
MPKAKDAETRQPDRSQLHRIIGELSDGIILLDADGSLDWANDAALAMHGVETLSELGETVATYQKRFHLAYRGGRPLSTDAYPMARLCRGETFADIVVNVCRAGRPEPDWVHCQRGLVLHQEGDAPHCLVLIITDATEAFEAEERFESIFNANPAPAVIVRLDDYRYVRVNEGFLELSGWRRDDLIGHSIYDLDILGDAEKKDQAKALLKKGHTIPQMEAELPIPGGGTKLVLVAGHPAEMNNEPCMIFTFADLEPRRKAEMALRQSEERFATAFRFAPVPMLLTSLDGHRILNVNHAFLDITGWGYEAIVGRKPADIELWETAATRREIERRIAESSAFRGYELRLKTRTGELVTCLVSAETVMINGQYCILAAFQDISDRKRTELDLIAAIEGAMQDSTWLSQKIMDRLAALRDPTAPSASALPAVELTGREREVLGLITKGKSDDAIADALSLKRNTVRNHVARLYAKIGAHNRGEAIIWARDRGHHLGAIDQ